MYQRFQHKTIIEINLDNLIFNFRSIKEKAGGATVIPVIKANAYGHGAVMTAKTLIREGAGFFAVSKLEEALELKDSGIDVPILIFSRLFPDQLANAVKADFRITLSCNEDIFWLEKANLPHPAFVHINVDTGFGGVGVRIDKESDFFDNLIHSSSCIWEGLYSQFSSSEEPDKTYSELQLSRFKNILSDICQKNKKPPMVHMANSAAIFNLPESHFDAVRPGISLYGHYLSPDLAEAISLKPVMSFKTFVAQISEIDAGCPVSYGRKWISKEKTRIAVLPVGFTDGIDRRLTNKGRVIIKDKFYPMVGTIAMDRIMIDIGYDPIDIGDIVIIWGKSEEKQILLSHLSDITGTSLFVLTCGIPQELKRKYITKV
jgi:alanine racemase